MNQARSNILKRLREGRKESFGVPVSDFSLVRDRNWNAAEKLDLFQQKIESVQGEVHRVAADRWVAELIRLLAEKKISNLLVSDRKKPALELREQWHEELPQLLSYQRPIEDWKSELFNQVDASLTTSRGAIAETGTLILWPDEDEPRLMSLVPPVHFVLLEADQIYSTFYQAMSEQGWASQGMPTNALLISGPSKTADIEQTLAYGVHGPAELIILVLE
ncbi:L-lactate dehydrogenase complex protein LldG [Marinospirillum celere]|uniref:L-lactate dehydrogenase complex protein LldG n=1 Tax=Marinospirillum celere TaxID=1122252 RepID=A0A1I1IZE3_9GAMM|nr:lactate utilization protein [Marinospirillum celere]SFC41677.1 L-lactate dehydrogenase complex protein LldG [Marinospirillum celere]